MKLPLLPFLLYTLLAFVSPLRAQDDAQIARLKTADDLRVVATKTADQAKLSEVLSDELRYAHSSGSVDTKASLIEALTNGRLKYTSYEYAERNFTFPAPGIALMTGRTNLQVASPTGTTTDLALSFLAVWREEKGQWRFLAWQSCKLPPPAAPAAK